MERSAWTPSTAIPASASKVSGESREHTSSGSRLEQTRAPRRDAPRGPDGEEVQMALHNQTLDCLDPLCARVCVCVCSRCSSMWLIIAKTVGMRETNSSQGTETERERGSDSRKETEKGERRQKRDGSCVGVHLLQDFYLLQLQTCDTRMKCKEEVPNKFYQGKQTQQITPLKPHE